MSPATEHDFAAGAQKIRFGSREEGHALVQRLLWRVTRERPAIVWLDDVHFSRDSIAFARYLMETQASEPLPVVVVLTARDEALVENPEALARIRELKALRGVEELAIGVLAPDDRAALVQELLGLEGELARQVQERTGGNPLFAVQLVNDWVQRGVLDVGVTGFVLRQGEEAVLPDDLYQVWVARVERLLLGKGADAAAALELAAVLGREVAPAEWVAICEHAGVALDVELLGRLFRERLAAPVDGGWVFTHAALRESLERKALEGGRWADYHRAAVRMLRMAYPPYFPRMQERIGRHLFEAGDYAEALEPLLDGASNQRVAAQYRDAHDLLDLREEALKLGGIGESDARWGAGWVLRSWIASNEGRIGDAWGWSEAAEVAARAHGWAAILPQALLGMGVAARDRGEMVRATALTDEAFALYQQQKNRLGMAHCLQGLGVLARMTGDLDWAQTQIIRALNLHEKINNAFGIGQCRLRLAEAVMQRSEWGPALELLRDALREFRAIAAPQMAALVMNAVGDVRRLSGDLDGALTEYERARRQFVRLGSTSLHYANIGMALVALERGDHVAAAAGLAAAREVLVRLERDGDAHRLSAGLMACAAVAGDWDEVVRWMADTAPLRGDGALVDRELAGFARLVGERAEAAGRLTLARDGFNLALEQWQRLGEREQAQAAAVRMRAVMAAMGTPA
jgi:tetratricopeptide (TPR) repeat protein